ncbi:hypothetical protein H8D98_00960 [bacterium]|nr:hypothetical protein [bacterium]
MNILADIKMYGRFAWGLRGFLRHKISLEEALATVRRRLAERETNFLRLVERGIFGYQRSPYLPLLKLAGCELGDIQNMVRTRGLEETLRALREAEVYVTFEEFKGREPIVRDGQVIPVQARDFDNPYLSHYYYASSSGTTGAGTRVPTDLKHLAAQAPFYMLARDVHGMLNVPMAIWLGILPDGSGIHNILCSARFGQVPQKWFSPITSRDFRFSLKNRLATEYIVVMGRLFGVSIPWPEPVSMDKAIVVARWAAETLKVHGACLIHTHVSKALRICLVAQEEGLDLTGATMSVGGEPPTPAKVRQITRTGACWMPIYPFSETGIVGLGCARPIDGNDLHFFKDALALIQYPRQVPGAGMTVDAFHFTTLLPTAPKLMLNVESDDYGVIENRSCGCPLETYGYTEHLRGIRSFRKLTGEGVTLVGSEMIHILEEVLPARFGGSPLDYQLLEEEDEKGFTRLSLLVSPKVDIADETAVIETILEALGQGSVAADQTRAIWSQARTLQVKRMEPVWTARGKLMPLHSVRRSERQTDAEAEDASVPKS